MIKDFPFFQQLESMDCGATCLRMVARYHGRYYSLEYLRELTRTGKQGVSLLEISDAAEYLGMNTLAASADGETLFERAVLPLIVHWKEDHYVVVYRINKKYVWVADPAFGKYKLSHPEFLQHWKGDAEEGIILILEPGPEFPQREADDTPKKGYERLYYYIGQYKSLILQVFSGLLLGTILQLVFLFLVVSFVDSGIAGADRDFLNLALISYLVLLLSAIFAGFIRNLIFEYVGLRVNIRLVSDFLAKVTRLPLRYFDNRNTDDIVQRMADHEKVQHFLASASVQTAFAFLNLLAFALVLAFWDPLIMGVFMGGIFLIILWVNFFQRKRRMFEYRKYDQFRQSQQLLNALVEGIQDIKMFGAEKTRRWAWERQQAKLIALQEDALRLAQWQRSGATFLHEAKNILLIFLAADALIDGSLSFGMLIGIQYMSGQLNLPINRLLEFFNTFQDTRLSLERLQEIHLIKDAESLGEKISKPKGAGDLVFDNLSFVYDSNQSKPTLHEINGLIKKGETTAIVGPSGSGKTTLMKLMLNFYEPSEGAIRVGDVNLKQLDERDWRKHCAWISSEGYIFQDTIARNIALGDEIIDQQRLLSVVKAVNLQHFVENLELGYHTMLGEDGMGLSQGQKQRLFIARALYKNPDYLFFDEATTSLDTFNEMLLMENVFDMMQGKTIVIITHQLPLVRYADHIIVLNEGELVEQGTHEVLISQKGLYHQLLKDQIALGK